MDFLAPVKMEKYTDLFVENGFESVETLALVEESHLIKLSIPLGH